MNATSSLDQGEMPLVLPLADPRADLATVGGKGASLARLAAAGLHVPDGFHLTTAAYQRYVDENGLASGIHAALQRVDPQVPASLEAASAAITALFAAGSTPAAIDAAAAAAYRGLPGLRPAVAVRSSATAEDLPDLSFAGQQETVLNVRGVDAVLQAIRQCWASLWTPRAIDYRMQHGVPSEGVRLAVVVQLLVQARAAGILFTADPMDGRRDRAVISAAWGLGETVVAGTVTPDTIVVDKGSRKVISRKTADKRVQTVQVEDGIDERPVPQDLCRAAVLDDAAAAELVEIGLQVEALYGFPVDIEWALSEGRFAVLQARPITALPRAERRRWKLPKGHYLAMRVNIVELMADPLSPLFRTLGLETISTSLSRTVAGFLGGPGLMPEPLILAVNGYAYYNGSLSLGAIARLLLRGLSIARRMFSGIELRWREARQVYVATVHAQARKPWRQAHGVEILAQSVELLERAIDYYGSLLGGVIPAAWISEGMFSAVYRLLIKRRNDPRPAAFLLGFDSAPILAEKSLYDLARQAGENQELARHLTDTVATELALQLDADRPPTGLQEADWGAWAERFREHLAQHGHAIYNLDFINPVGADDPAPLLETVRYFLQSPESDPNARQRAAAERRQQATQLVLQRLGGLRLRLFRWALNLSQHYAPLREDGIADIGLGYPLLRQQLLELGRRFAEQGLIRAAQDIFWLTREEVQQSVVGTAAAERLHTRVLQRMAERRALAQVAPPRVLPHLALVDRLRQRLGIGRRKRVLRGVAASPGRVSGTARVLLGPRDFEQMQAGDVLVASITTPAWTPLFVRAAAVVTDVGGPLSHGSIVAREYGIPAVLGTGEATSRIRSGQRITVDGSAGKVYLEADTG